MMGCGESGGSIQRTIAVTVRPTPVELARAIREMSSDEQISLLRCLKRRFCEEPVGAEQLADVANTLDAAPAEKAEEARAFVRFLDEYLLGASGVQAGYEKAKKEIEEELLKCYSGYPEKEAM